MSTQNKSNTPGNTPQKPTPPLPEPLGSTVRREGSKPAEWHLTPAPTGEEKDAGKA